MEPSMSNKYSDPPVSNILFLARRLRQEQLFCKSEQKSIKDINEEILKNAELLAHTFWTSRQHHLNLDKLITDNAQGTPAYCCSRSNQLSTMQFVDGFKVLGYQESQYGMFLQSLRNNPTLVAACLAYGDKLNLTSTRNVVDSLVLGLYGNSVIADDHHHLLELMQTLMLLQLADDERPRKILQKGNAAFCIVYKLFTDSLMSSKLFLTSALHSPVMNVILSTDLLLETDPNKILDCFNADEIEKRFGKRDDSDFDTKVKEHLQRTEEELIDICSSFVDNLHNSMHNFPHSLGWVISRVYSSVKDAGAVSDSDALALAADLLMQSFICPAIVNPELYGVSGDVPITEITRFNLMQIAQVLQTMALSTDSDSTSGIYKKFDQTRIRALLDSVINSCHDDNPPQNASITDGFVDCIAFLTPQQLNNIIHFLFEIQSKTLHVVSDNQASNVHGVDQSSLSEILSHLPATPPEALSAVNKRNGSIGSNDISPEEDGSSSPSKSRLKPTDHDTRGKGKDRGSSKDSNGSDPHSRGAPPVVMAISLNPNGGDKPPGLLTETEVLVNHRRYGLSDAFEDKNQQNSTETQISDKRLRFSAFSTDMSEMCEGTIENSSQASNSSMDDLDQPESMQADDTSSFHGTSSHGNHEEDIYNETAEDLESVPHTNNDEALKALESKLPTSRESIEDKMRKFEIRPTMGVRFGGTFVAPETSGQNYGDTRSETWSTDAYLSDSEAPPEQDERNESSGRLQEIAEGPDPTRQPPRPNATGSASPYLAIISRDDDSRSEVWSVEVLPSDSEPPDVKPEDRLQELESESNAGAEDERDPLEDSRSRASTPGLSAASGVSGTSGLSLVSDNVHGKNVGGYLRSYSATEEQGSSSEKSYGKGGSSVSPDVEDMLSNHPPKPQQPTTDVTSASPVPFQNTPSISNLTQMKKQPNTKQATTDLISWDKNTLNDPKNIDKLPKSESDKWSNASSFGSSDHSAFNSKNKDLNLLESECNSNTIKRSPFKQASSSDDQIASKPLDNTTVTNDLLLSFDPLMKDEANKQAKPDNEAPKEEKPVSNIEATSKLSPSASTRPKEIKNNTDSMPQKQSKRQRWWKNTRFGSRTKSTTTPPTAIKQSSSSSDILSPEQITPPDISNSPSDPDMVAAAVLHSSPIKTQDEDIMAKYIRKAASASKPSKTSLDLSDSNGIYFSLDDSEDRNKTTLTNSDTINTTPTLNTTDGHMSSATSDGTVTTATRNISVASGSGDSFNKSSYKEENYPVTNVVPKVPTSDELISDAVKKIRIILSNTDTIPEPLMHDQLSLFNHDSKDVNHNHRHLLKKKHHRSQLLTFIRSQLSEAINLQTHARVTQLQETIRCVRTLDDEQCSKVIQKLWTGYKERSVYIEYLIRTKQSLLTTLSYIKHMTQTAKKGEQTCKWYFMAVCVRLFLRKKEIHMKNFRSRFSQITAADDKVTLVNNFLSWLYGQLAQDPMFEGTSEDQLTDAERSVERSVFCCVYKLALFPNGDGDRLRDQLYYDHITRLRKVITPYHHALQIPEKYLFECPWKSAQDEIKSINAYRTPREKVACVLRCADIILNLLKMADEGGVPGADDFTPVLVYVLIMANPVSLLSTVQYVSSFIGNDLSGEEAYWWMQFTAATEFIKTIDERK